VIVFRGTRGSSRVNDASQLIDLHLPATLTGGNAGDASSTAHRHVALSIPGGPGRV